MLKTGDGTSVRFLFAIIYPEEAFSVMLLGNQVYRRFRVESTFNCFVVSKRGLFEMSPPPEGFGDANLTRQVGTAKKASHTLNA